MSFTSQELDAASQWEQKLHRLGTLVRAAEVTCDAALQQGAPDDEIFRLQQLVDIAQADLYAHERLEP